MRKAKPITAKSSAKVASFGLPLFLGTFGLLSKASLCALRWLRDNDSPANGLVTGNHPALRIIVASCTTKQSKSKGAKTIFCKDT